MASLDLRVDKYIEKAFQQLCVYLSFNPPDAEAYRKLHQFMLNWIKENSEP